MALASIPRVVLGSIAFAIFWVLAVFPAVPFLPIGRTAGSLLGAMLMVVFRVLTPEEAYSAVDLNILGLLFGTMVVSVYLERADMFRYLGKLLSWKSRGAKDMMLRICLISAVSSALFTNDTSCVVLTEFVLKITRQHNLPPHPFLLALASSANIGSSATPIGNPQNLVIAVQSGISFGEFLIGLLPAMVAGVFVNAAILLGMYWKVLSVHKDIQEELEDCGGGEVVEEDSVISHRFSPATMSHVSALGSPEWILEENLSYSQRINNSGGQLLQETLRNRIISSAVDNSNISDLASASSSSSSPSPPPPPPLEIKDHSNAATAGGSLSSVENVIHVEVETAAAAERKKIWSEKRKRLVWKLCVYIVTVGMLVALLVGLNMSWTAITAALALVVLDFKDARPSLDKVSYSLLIFFCGMFITVEGFNKTGIPGKLWEIMEPYSEVNHGSGVAVLAVVILILSNVASNVPTVLLLGGRVAASAAMVSASDEKKAWLVLAWVSTVAGNLSLLGSAANLIVCEQARRAPLFSYNLTFWRHLKFGVPSTLIVTAIGLLLIR